MTSENIIETVGLCYRYAGNDRDSLSEVSVRIRKGVKTVILGANGAGKSTLFYHFNGVFEPAGGKVMSCSRGSRSPTGGRRSGS